MLSLLYVGCWVCSGLCDRLITCLEDSYWLCLAVACDPDISKRRNLGLIWAVAPQEKPTKAKYSLPRSQKPITNLSLYNGFSLRFQF
jgi:hypothetical protein